MAKDHVPSTRSVSAETHQAKFKSEKPFAANKAAALYCPGDDQ